ncbi:MAG: hypothetical protein HY360_22075 [Verrucomicrobia bacterium]|nr:hypothetical protein [Verrucomicrobiota bacterium]
MNKKQKIVIRLAVLIAALLGLFPPWVQTYHHVQVGYSRVPTRYAFIGTPPSPQSGGPYYGVQVDLTRLLLQWFVVVLIAGGLACTLRDDSKKEPSSGAQGRT